MSIIEKMVDMEPHHQDQDHAQVLIKGKRTKRQRPHSPLTLAMVSSSCSAVESGGELGERLSYNNNNNNSGDHLRGMQGAAASPTSSVDFATSTEEEEDMANCLILLAQGHTNRKLSAELQQASNIPTTSKGAAAPSGLYVYECKTCNRCFPSFQALGGHRASHKKSKPNNNNDERKGLVFMDEDPDDHCSNMSTTLSLQIANRALYASTNNNKVNKVHECSICGAEFSSGQALGGHMRRHRAFMSSNTTAAAATTTTALSMGTSSGLDHQSPEAKKPRNLLQLDLNLPAPEDDRRESKFSFSSKEQVIVFSASSLVDCHY